MAAPVGLFKAIFESAKETSKMISSVAGDFFEYAGIREQARTERVSNYANARSSGTLARNIGVVVLPLVVLVVIIMIARK